VVNVDVKEEGDIIYDVLVYGDTEDGRVFRIGWDDVVTNEDYTHVLDCTAVVTAIDADKVPLKKRDGWKTVLNGEDAVYYSIRVAMRKYDDELVKKGGKLVRARALNIPEDWTFERGAAPLRTVGLNAGKDGRNPETVSRAARRTRHYKTQRIPHLNLPS
jgi:hypothetical protein